MARNKIFHEAGGVGSDPGISTKTTTIMKKHPLTILSSILLAAASSGVAGTIVTQPVSPDTTSSNAFERARRPISNPTLFDLALPQTNVHPIFMYQHLPSRVTTTAGPLIMGGDVQVYALQFEIAFNERLSLVATKDGYVDFNPSSAAPWTSQSGFADIGLGLKYAFIYDPVNAFVVSGTATYELPTGNSDVFQGQGDGMLNLIVSGVKLWDQWQVAGGAGVRLPMNSQQSTGSFISGHVSYEVTPWFIPLVELNWHHVLEPGDGRANFSQHAGGLTPVVATFEGNDLLNFGAVNASQNRDLVTTAVGFRSRVSDQVDVGFAYEFPLTSDEKGIIEDRFTVDLVWRF